MVVVGTKKEWGYILREEVHEEICIFWIYWIYFYFLISSSQIKEKFQLTTKVRGSSRCIIVNRIECCLEASEFDLQSSYYVNLQTNTFAKGMAGLSSWIWVK